MAIQEGISLLDAWYSRLHSNTEIQWQPPVNSRPVIHASLTRGLANLYLRSVRISTVGRIRVDLATTQSAGDNAELSHQFELHGSITIRVGSHEITVQMAGNDLSDPYSFIPSNQTDLVAFYNAVVAETDHAAGVDLNDGYEWFTLRPSDVTASESGHATAGSNTVSLSSAFSDFTNNSSAPTSVFFRVDVGRSFSPQSRVILNFDLDDGVSLASDVEIDVFIFSSGGSLRVTLTRHPVLTRIARNISLTTDQETALRSVINGQDVGLSIALPGTTPTLPAAPSWTTATASAVTVTLNQALASPITVPEVDAGSPVPDYFLVSGPTGLSFDHTTRQISGTPTTASPASIVVRARSEFGQADYTIPLTSGILPDPTTPTNVTLVAGDAQIEASCDEVESAASYQWQYRAGTTGNWTTHTETTRSVTITGLTNNQAYQVRVLARNSSADSAYTTAVSATPAVAPAVPADVGSFFAVKGHAIEGAYKDEASGEIARAGVNDRDSLTLPTATDVATNGAVTYGIVETLPAGLSFDTSTRVLSGTLDNSVSVSGVTEAMTFTYRVTRGSITVDRSFTITLGATAATPAIAAVGAAPTTLNLTVGQSAGPHIYQITGAPLPANSVVGTVPDGVTVSLLQPTPGTAGVFTISGIPTANASGFFTLRAQNAEGTDDLRIDYVITGGDEAPEWNDDTGDRVNARVGDEINILVPAVDSGSPAPTYAEVGDVLSELGLSFSGTTRRITGTVTAALTRTITIRASNTVDGAAASDDWTIVLSFQPALVAPEFSPATGTAVTGDVGTAVTINVPDPGGNPTPTLTADIPADIAGDLTFNASNRTITGTPTVEDSGGITVTATNSQGSSTWSVSYTFTIPDAAPEWDTDTGASLTGDAGVVVVDVTIPEADRGHPAPTYSATGVPAGLTFTPSSRQLAGTPTAAGSGTIVITASNTEGSDEFSIAYNFSKPERAPSWVNNTGADASWQATVAITNITIPAADPRTNPDPTYSASGLPDGVVFDAMTRVISGTPAASTADSSGTVTITATNTVDGTERTGTFTFDYAVAAAPIVDVAPFWSETTGTTATLAVGTAITDLVIPEANGTPAPTYSIEGDLPFGLSFDANTRTISGTPLVSGTFAIDVRATNTEDVADWRVTYTVEDVDNSFTFLMPASTFDQQSSSQVKWQTDGGTGEAPRPQLPASFIDGGVDRLVQRVRLRSNGQLQLALSDSATAVGVNDEDLSENFEVTGVVSLFAESNTATISMASLGDDTETYEGISSDLAEVATVQALFNAVVTEADGTVPLVVTLSRTPFAAPAFPSASGDAITGTESSAITSVTVPEATGVPSPTYSATGLPAGLAFDDSTRVISGTPTGNGEGTITVTATNSYGGSNHTATFTIAYNISALPVAPSWGNNDSGAALNVNEDSAITPIIVPPVSVGTTPVTYAATGLPAGLTFVPATRTISGTPTTPATGTIVVTATNSVSTDTYTIAWTINELSAPSWGTNDTGNRITGTVGTDIVPVTVPVPPTGNPTPTYAAKDATLPRDLVFNSQNRRLTGAPRVASSGTIIIVATNDGGSDEYKIPYTFAASANPPPVPSNLVGTVGDEQVTLTWQAAGDDVTGYELEYKLSSASSWTDFLGEADNLGSVVSGLINGNSYDFRVRSLIGGEVSQWSDILALTPQSNAATDFDIRYRPVGDDGMYSMVNTRRQLVTITELENDVPYSFEVRANNLTGFSDWSAPVILVPTLVFGRASSFRIRYRPDNSSQPYLLEEVTLTTATVGNLSNDTPYDFAVQARNDGGGSDYTDEITLTPVRPLNPATSFQVRYRPYGSMENYRFVTTTQNTVVILNLMNQVIYEFSVQGINDDGRSDWTPPIYRTPVAPLELGISSGEIKISETAYRTHGGTFGVIDFSQKALDGSVDERAFEDDIRATYNLDTSEAIAVYENLKAQRNGVVNSWRLNEDVEVRGFLREFRITMDVERSSLYLRIKGIPPAGG